MSSSNGKSQRYGDLFEVTKDSAGTISRCKIGDFVVALSPETAAAGSRIVFEAKEDKSYAVNDALAELQKALENRDAQVGIFVFSRATAPINIEPLTRWGQNLLLVWDAQESTTDVYFRAAISLARLMVVQESKALLQTTACVADMDAAVATLTRDLGLLDDITRMAQTVKNSGQNILLKAESLRSKIGKHLETFRDQIDALKNGLPT